MVCGGLGHLWNKKNTPGWKLFRRSLVPIYYSVLLQPSAPSPSSPSPSAVYLPILPLFYFPGRDITYYIYQCLLSYPVLNTVVELSWSSSSRTYHCNKAIPWHFLTKLSGQRGIMSASVYVTECMRPQHAEITLATTPSTCRTCTIIESIILV